VNVGPAGFGHGVEALPYAVAGEQIKAAEFAVTVNTVNVIALDDRSGYAAMQAFSIFCIFALLLPDFFDGEPLRIEFQQERAVKETADKEIIIFENRAGNVLAEAVRGKWVLPAELSIQWIKAGR